MHAMVRPLLFAAATIVAASCTTSVAEPRPGGPLARAFADASDATGVPRELLMAVGYVETRWRTPRDVGHDDHRIARAGLMGVADGADRALLSGKAAELGVDADAARTAGPANILIAAHVLADLGRKSGGGALPTTASGWRPALELYGAADDEIAGRAYAADVLRVVEQGAAGEGDDGEQLALQGAGGDAPAADDGNAGTKTQGLDDASVYQWLPARAGHWHAGRSQAVDRVIIHTTEGSYWGAIGWFRSAANPYQTSAHYVIRSSDGQVTQMVREADTAYHIGGWNPRAIGIEHEAWAGEGYLWFTDEMLRASAALTRGICQRWGIPMDREHIVGHVEVPGASHWDPGPHFPWDYYMELVRGGAPAQPAGFCATHDGTWCDGADVVTCAGGGEQARTWCAHGCQTMPWGTPDQCAAPPADVCGGLDYHGACDGSLMRWCEGGAVRTYDCAVQGETCGWQDDVVGNNCVAAWVDPCEGLSYQGECRGAQLRWCENGALREAQCGTCGWQNDVVGFNCL